MLGSTAQDAAPLRRNADRPGHAPAAQPEPTKHRPLLVFAAAVASHLLLWASFPPIDQGWLAWVAPLPWLLLARCEPKPRYFYRTCYLAGLVYWLASVQWMRLGHATMYTAWVALALYLALYQPLQMLLCRRLAHRWRLPLFAAAPIAWLTLEWLRAHLLSGFPWYLLGHTQYRWPALIQVSDLVGAYGVTFLVAMTCGLLADAVPAGWLDRSKIALAPGWLERRQRGARVASVSAVVGVLAACLAYGAVRLRQAEFIPGPLVAMVQANIPQKIKTEPKERQEIFDAHVRLTAEAAEHRPDLILWPESMLRWPIVVLDPKVTEDDLQRLDFSPQVVRDLARDMPPLLARLADRNESALLIGAEAFDITPAQGRSYNSALLVTPQGGLVGRYDKVHLVPFGEYLPLAGTLPWLLKLTPFERAYGFDSGGAAQPLQVGEWRFATLICFEDTVPHLVRRVVAAGHDSTTRRDVDILINLTNDGWFHGSSELEQHLITAAFRAVECRVPLVRAANTGVSAVVDGNGRILPESIARDAHGEYKQVEAVGLCRVPLDSRRSPYVVYGDWLPMLCAGVCALSWLVRGS